MDDPQHRGERSGMDGEQASQGGNDTTHWRTGTLGMTWSTRWAAASAMRRVPREGQMPRRLREKATNFSSAQPLQRKRRKPWARMPHCRYASNSSATNVGRPAPPLSMSTKARKVSRCSCTTR